MATFRSLASRFSALIRRRELDDRVDEELQYHLRMQCSELAVERSTKPQHRLGPLAVANGVGSPNLSPCSEGR
jgi:hypothetical protein